MSVPPTSPCPHLPCPHVSTSPRPHLSCPHVPAHVPPCRAPLPCVPTAPCPLGHPRPHVPHESVSPHHRVPAAMPVGLGAEEGEDGGAPVQGPGGCHRLQDVKVEDGVPGDGALQPHLQEGRPAPLQHPRGAPPVVAAHPCHPRHRHLHRHPWASAPRDPQASAPGHPWVSAPRDPPASAPRDPRVSVPRDTQTSAPSDPRASAPGHPQASALPPRQPGALAPWAGTHGHPHMGLAPRGTHERQSLWAGTQEHPQAAAPWGAPAPCQTPWRGAPGSALP